jgi:glycosyltransferase involved in cell wall biosynthesis
MSRPPSVMLINSMGTGGAERAVAMLVVGLRDRGHDVRVLCLERTAQEIELPGCPRRYLSRMASSAAAAGKLAALPLLAGRLAAIVKSDGVRVVISHLFRANFVNVLARSMWGSRQRAILVNHTRVSRLQSDGVQGRINLSLCRRLYPRSDLVASVSRGSAAECGSVLDLADGKSITMYDPIDTEGARSASASNPPAEALVAVGRLIDLKRFHEIIDAFARVAGDYPGLELRIVGDGPAREALQRRAGATAVGERIRFLGRLDNPFPVLAGCRAFVSASETEGFGMAIVESLASGVPVIAADCAYGPREILAPSTDPTGLMQGTGVEQAEHGILYPVGSVESLEKAMRVVLDDDGFRAALSERGPRRAADFSVARSLDAYERVLLDE